MSVRAPAPVLALSALLAGCAAGVWTTPPAPARLPAVGAAAAAAADRTLRVMTYNIHAGRDADGIPNLERVATIVREHGADIVLLQEVDRGTERAGGEDQLARLQALTGFHGAFGKSLDYQGGEYGIAILSRWPVRGTRTIPLPVEPPQERAGGSYEPRVALFAEVDTPTGEVSVMNTHLDPSPTAVYRAQEMTALLAAAAELPAGRLLFFGGDLNARPESTIVRALAVAFRDAFATCGRGRGESYPAHAPDRRIDYILYRGEATCADAFVIETTASDHRPLLAAFRLPTSSRP